MIHPGAAIEMLELEMKERLRRKDAEIERLQRRIDELEDFIYGIHKNCEVIAPKRPKVWR